MTRILGVNPVFDRIAGHRGNHVVMPIRFAIDESLRYFVSVIDGTVTDEDISREYSAFTSGGEWRPTMHELVDLSAADMSQLTGGGLRTVAELFARLFEESGVRMSKTAVYAPHTLPFAVARMYEILSRDSKEVVRVFTDRDAAMRWLDVHVPDRDLIHIDDRKRVPDSRRNSGALSAREVEVLALIAAGSSNQEIAETLLVSVFTVKAHTRNIYSKLEVTSRTKAVAKAVDLGLV